MRAAAFGRLLIKLKIALIPEVMSLKLESYDFGIENFEIWLLVFSTWHFVLRI